MHRIRCLGGFALTDADGRDVELPTRKCGALLAVLAVQGRDGMGRDALAALLWPDMAERQARANLRQNLSMVRKAAGDLVHGDGDRLRLDGARADSDVDALRRVLEGSGEVDAIADLYQGDLLEGVMLKEDTFTEWAARNGRALQEKVFSVLGARLCGAGDGAAAGPRADALRSAEVLLTLDPSYEPAHQAVMRVHLHNGAKSEAIKQYLRCREVLSEELGVSTGAATEALYREILRDQPAPVPVARPPRPAADRLIVAVPPLEYGAGDPARSDLAGGIVDEVVAQLSRFHSLGVLARASAGAFRDPNRGIGEVGRELGVDYVLTGSLRGAGERFRLAVQLVEVEKGCTLWAKRYDFTAPDLLDVEDRIVTKVVSGLTVNIDGSRLRHAKRNGDADLHAYEYCLQGSRLLRKGSLEHDEAARRLFRKALEICPDYPGAYSGLSQSYFNEWSCRVWHRWRETEAEAFRHATKALELDEADHVSHLILGRVPRDLSRNRPRAPDCSSTDNSPKPACPRHGSRPVIRPCTDISCSYPLSPTETDSSPVPFDRPFSLAVSALSGQFSALRAGAEPDVVVRPSWPWLTSL